VSALREGEAAEAAKTGREGVRSQTTYVFDVLDVEDLSKDENAGIANGVFDDIRQSLSFGAFREDARALQRIDFEIRGTGHCCRWAAVCAAGPASSSSSAAAGGSGDQQQEAGHEEGAVASDTHRHATWAHASQSNRLTATARPLSASLQRIGGRPQRAIVRGWFYANSTLENLGSSLMGNVTTSWRFFFFFFLRTRSIALDW
jgi:hypothetical protein